MFLFSNRWNNKKVAKDTRTAVKFNIVPPFLLLRRRSNRTPSRNEQSQGNLKSILLRGAIWLICVGIHMPPVATVPYVDGSVRFCSMQYSITQGGNTV